MTKEQFMRVLEQDRRCRFVEQLEDDLIDYEQQYDPVEDPIERVAVALIDDWVEQLRALRQYIATAASPDTVKLTEKQQEVAWRKVDARVRDGETSTGIENEFHALTFFGCAGADRMTDWECDEYLETHDEEGQSLPEPYED